MKPILALISLLLLASCSSQTPSNTSTADTPATVQASDQPPVIVDDAPVETPAVAATPMAPDLDNNGVPFIDKPIVNGVYRVMSSSSLPEDCPVDIGPTCEPFLVMLVFIEVHIDFNGAAGYGIYLRGDLTYSVIVSELEPHIETYNYSTAHRFPDNGDNAALSASLQNLLAESVYQVDAFDINGNGSGLTAPITWERGND